MKRKDSTILTVRMDAELMARLRSAAKEAGTDVSAVVRRLINEYFGYGTEQLQTALVRQTALEAETRKVIDRVEAKIARLKALTAEEPARDRAIKRRGGDPGEAAR